MKSHFQTFFNYNNYRLLDRSQTCNRKMTDKKGKYVKRMETFMNTYKFDENGYFTVLRFLVQFNRACDSNKVSEGIALWVVSNLMKDGPASSHTARMTSLQDAQGEYPLFKVEEELIKTYGEAMSYALKSDETDSNIANANLKIVSLRKASNEIAVQFPDVLRTKVVRCENAYPEERTKSICIDRLPANIQSPVCMS